MHTLLLDYLSDEQAGFMMSVQLLEQEILGKSLGSSEVKPCFADLFPSARLFSSGIQQLPSIYRYVRDFLDKHGANMTRHNSHRDIMTITINLYEEAEDRTAAVDIAKDVISEGRKKPSRTDENCRATVETSTGGGHSIDRLANNVAMRFEDTSLKFHVNIGECWQEYVDEYQQVARDHKLSQQQKLDYLHNLLFGDAKRFYLDVVQSNSISSISFQDSQLVGLQNDYEKDKNLRAHHIEPKKPYERKGHFLTRKGKICIQEGEFKLKLLHDYYSTPNMGPLGIIKTINRILPKFYWKNMRSDILRNVRSCRCQRTKSANQKPLGLLKPLEAPESKWTEITMDFITPLPASSRRNTGILTVMDRLSKMIRIIQTEPNTDALKTAQLFKDYIYRNRGLPSNIICDRDSIFMSKFWKGLFGLL